MMKLFLTQAIATVLHLNFMVRSCPNEGAVFPRVFYLPEENTDYLPQSIMLDESISTVVIIALA